MLALAGLAELGDNEILVQFGKDTLNLHHCPLHGVAHHGGGDVLHRGPGIAIQREQALQYQLARDAQCLSRAGAAGQQVRQQAMTADALASIRNRRIGFVFQQFNLLPRTSALENVELPMVYGGIKAPERHERAMKALTQVGLGERFHHTPAELSGGQQQRVAIARALVNQPQLILADEPTGALDSQTSEDIMNLLTELNKTGMTVVLVTHEPDIAEWARRKIVFKDGHIIEDVVQTGGKFFDEPPLEKLAPLGGSAAHEVASVGVISA